VSTEHQHLSSTRSLGPCDGADAGVDEGLETNVRRAAGPEAPLIGMTARYLGQIRMAPRIAAVPDDLRLAQTGKRGFLGGPAETASLPRNAAQPARPTSPPARLTEIWGHAGLQDRSWTNGRL